jgi:geranylgeranyl pyrophosphate synthase
MMNPIIELNVPVEVSLRNEIRKKIEAFFQIHKILPPASYEKLYAYATSFIEENGWDEQYRAFIMVCCGNAIWRRVVGTVPYNRRILLLPQCLRNSYNCKAKQDELGILCSECGNCNIPNFLREAENLGYVALVTEGTTVTTKLLESGKVDAVIGVGCMESLQKIFASVNKYSIPGIGVPLLTCGCKDTLADSEWIKHEINYYKVNGDISLLNLNHIRNKTASIFGEDQLNRMLESSQSDTEKIALESLLLGGQRIRPFLALLAYEAFCKNPDPAIVNRLALSVECFHKASLIHDDIEDNDNHRYGKETIHARYGVPVAINTGDFLIGEGYRLIAESNLPAEILSQSMMVISREHKNLTLGQGAELISIRTGKLLSLEEMLKVFENKTAAAFKVSLLLGATIGGADKASLQLLDKFSHAIGIAYQIKDDLSDYKGEKGDIAIRKFSILLSILFEKLSESEKALLSNIDSVNLNEWLEGHHIRTETETLLISYINEAKSCLDNFDNMGLKLALHEILGKIFKDYL